MRGEENTNPVNSSRFTPSLYWGPMMVSEGNACCTCLSRLGFRACDIAILIYGENAVELECVRPRTVELFHKLMIDRVNLDEAEDEHSRKLYGMMVEESELLFTHALDEDMAAWNRSGSGL